jgi:translation initiation factor IF-2
LQTEDNKPSWGGFRVGSGRKPKLQYEAREEFNAWFDTNQTEIMDTLLRHIKRGNFQAMIYVLDQRFGKAPQTLESININKNLNVDVDVTKNEFFQKPEVKEKIKEINLMLKEEKMK